MVIFDSEEMSEERGDKGTRTEMMEMFRWAAHARGLVTDYGIIWSSIFHTGKTRAG